MAASERPDAHQRLRGKHVCICVGAGGVGKTTTSAALALGLSAAGAKVAAVTIDPAARLAEALGLQQLSSTVAGSQELSAIAKLYELRHERDFDVIVLDTPPSRNAVDFIEAPARLLGFLEGRALKLFLAPGGLAARVFGRSTSLVLA